MTTPLDFILRGIKYLEMTNAQLHFAGKYQDPRQSAEDHRLLDSSSQMVLYVDIFPKRYKVCELSSRWAEESRSKMQPKAGSWRAKRPPGSGESTYLLVPRDNRMRLPSLHALASSPLTAASLFWLVGQETYHVLQLL